MSEGGAGDDTERTVLHLRSIDVDASAVRDAPVQLGHVLPVRTRLRDYEITGLIGEGGFGIVYLAWDHSLQRKVALKEYMPASIASRVAGSSALVVKSERHLDTFRAGLKSFVNEARLLARFDHPSLVKVYRFWEENGTAYMVMPFYEGPTLKAALAELGHVPGETVLRAWLRPLLDALAVMHVARCYHRDIAPDNILITPAGPLLLDFGAARRVIGDMTHALTVVLKPGFAPIEQYGEVATMAQGAWTDLYALACVVYYAITGRTPMTSVERLMDDRLAPLASIAAGRYSASFIAAVDAALAVRPSERTQSVAEFRARLDAGLADAVPDAAVTSPGELGPASDFGRATVPGTLTPELVTQRFVRELAADVVAPEPAGDTAPGAQARVAAPEAPHVAAAFAATEIVPRQPQPVASAAAAEDSPSAFIHPAVSRPAASRNAARRGAVVAVAVLLLAGVAAFVIHRQRESPAAVVEPAEAAASASPSAAASASLATSTSTSVSASESAAASASISASTAAPGASATAAPVAAEAPRITHVAPRVRSEAAMVPRPVPVRPRAESSRCSDILQKASLEPLTADEAAYLKKECR